MACPKIRDVEETIYDKHMFNNSILFVGKQHNSSISPLD
jgi:hypothetical protein